MTVGDELAGVHLQVARRFRARSNKPWIARWAGSSLVGLPSPQRGLGQPQPVASLPGSEGPFFAEKVGLPGGRY
jgi:hypothetical protein